MSSVLVIEDDEKFQQGCIELLRRAGHRAQGSRDGAAALQVLRAERIDVVLTDVLMPGVDGLEAILRLGEEHPHLRFVAMSGGGAIARQDALELCRQLGVTTTLAKPFTMDQLLDAVAAARRRPPGAS